MAGIKEAKAMVATGRNKGQCLAVGRCGQVVDGPPYSNYILVRIYEDQGVIHAIDYGSDVRVARDIEPGDEVELLILGDHAAAAAWVRLRPIGPERLTSAELRKIQELQREAAQTSCGWDLT